MSELFYFKSLTRAEQREFLLGNLGFLHFVFERPERYDEKNMREHILEDIEMMQLYLEGS